MNDLKFRAWWIDAEEYVKVSGIDFINEEIHMTEEYKNGTYSIDEIPFDEVILEQYTGLKDKNGKEIYVGDILIDRECNQSYVISNLYEFHILFKNYIEREETTLTHIRVGGHIHENKELLK